ncbi:MAG: GNAT family N-acetyltransferase [Asgard group archaeon]|nr:GNAT family N-acetyltransferase [Asgard group archaeon]
MDFIIRTMKKNDSSDKEFFDYTNFESYKTTLKDSEKYSEEELHKKFQQFEEDDPLDINESKHSVFILETYNGIKVGLIWITNREPFWRFNDQLAWIYNLHTIPEFRKQGLARLLMIRAEEWAVDQNLNSIALHVLNDNTFARNLYESLGYELVVTHNTSCFYEKKV